MNKEENIRYLKRRIEHCKKRSDMHNNEARGKEEKLTYHSGRIGGYWAGLLEGYQIALDIINELDEGSTLSPKRLG